VVWARAGIRIERCPKSYVTPESLAWLEEFWSWKLIGGLNLLNIPARTAEAFGLLETEWLKTQAG
jgi:hypothetical protein